MQKFRSSIVEYNYIADPNSEYQINLQNLHKYGFHKICKWIFIVFFIFLPILNNILGSYSVYYAVDPNRTLNTEVIQIINIILATGGFILVVLIQGGIIFRTGPGAFFLFALLMGPLMLLFQVMMGAFISPNLTIPGNTHVRWIIIINLATQIFGEIVLIIITLRWNKTLWKRITSTFKSFKHIDNLFSFVLIIGVGMAIAYAANAAFHVILIAIKSNTEVASSNQDNINGLMKSLPGKILLIPLTLIIAPIAEEFATREGIMGVFGKDMIYKNKEVNKKSFRYILYVSLSVFISVIYFSNMHTIGDFQAIYSYVGTSIVFTLMFLFAKRNTVYNIALHGSWNLLALIMVFTK